MLVMIIRQFSGRTVLTAEVFNELVGDTQTMVSRVKWCETAQIETPEELADWNQLRKAWPKRGEKSDRGEAACIVLAQRRGWSLVMDDGFAITKATQRGIPVMRTTNLIACAVRAGWWSADDAWAAYCEMTANGRTMLGPAIWRPGDEADFRRLCGENLF